MANPVCFMDFDVEGKPLGRIEVVLRRDIVSWPAVCSR